MENNSTIENIIEKTSIDSLNKAVRCLNNISIYVEKELKDFDSIFELINQSKKLQTMIDFIINRSKENKITLEETGLSDTSISMIEIYSPLTDEEEDLDFSIDSKNYDSYKIYLKDMLRIPLLSKEEERSLIEEYYKTKDKRIKDKLVNHNLRLVAKMAKRYQGRGLDYLDLIQEGNMGLIEAVEHFNPAKEVRLSTYAVWRIRKKLSRAVKEKGKTIRIPIYVYEQYNELSSKRNELEEKLGREATIKEIAKYMNISEKSITDLISMFNNPISLETPVGDESDTELQEMINDESALDPEQSAIKKEQIEMVNLIIEELPEKERNIMKERFGIGVGRAKTQDELAKKYNCTKERIRMIEAKALRTLRRNIKLSNNPKTKILEKI